MPGVWRQSRGGLFVQGFRAWGGRVSGRWWWSSRVSWPGGARVGRWKGWAICPCVVGSLFYVEIREARKNALEVLLLPGSSKQLRGRVGGITVQDNHCGASLISQAVIVVLVHQCPLFAAHQFPGRFT